MSTDVIAAVDPSTVQDKNVLWFSELGLADLESVGGKNSSLGEMVSNLADAGVRVPDGFATTADAYRRFIGTTGLAEKINSMLTGLDTDDVRELARVGRTDPHGRRRAAVPDRPRGRHPSGVRPVGR